MTITMALCWLDKHNGLYIEVNFEEIFFLSFVCLEGLGLEENVQLNAQVNWDLATMMIRKRRMKEEKEEREKEITGVHKSKQQQQRQHERKFLWEVASRIANCDPQKENEKEKGKESGHQVDVSGICAKTTPKTTLLYHDHLI